MWPLSKCTRCYVTTCLLWTPVGVRVVDDETRVKYLEEGRGGGAAFAGCVPWWMGWWYLGQIDRQSVCWYRRYFRNVHRTLRQILHIGRPPSLLHFFLNFDKQSSFYGLIKKKFLLSSSSWLKMKERSQKYPLLIYNLLPDRIERRKLCIAPREQKELDEGRKKKA